MTRVVYQETFYANIGGPVGSPVGGPTEVAPPAERGCSIQQIRLNPRRLNPKRLNPQRLNPKDCNQYI